MVQVKNSCNCELLLTNLNGADFFLLKWNFCDAAVACFYPGLAEQYRQTRAHLTKQQATPDARSTLTFTLSFFCLAPLAFKGNLNSFTCKKDSIISHCSYPNENFCLTIFTLFLSNSNSNYTLQNKFKIELEKHRIKALLRSN